MSPEDQQLTRPQRARRGSKQDQEQYDPASSPPGAIGLRKKPSPTIPPRAPNCCDGSKRAAPKNSTSLSAPILLASNILHDVPVHAGPLGIS
jgi:hypothetical protein